MTLIEAIILGLVQGATEFLPVSSSGHLTLAGAFLGVKEPSLLFDILLHVGTLIAIVGYFRKSIVAIVKDSLAALAKLATGDTAGAWEFENFRIAVFIVIASFPTALLGLGIEKTLPRDFDAIVLVVGAMLILNGFILTLNRWVGDREIRELSPKRALILGVAQGFAVLPGISRSGTTITCALFLGMNREKAAEFSFLMSIPAILGALILKWDGDALADANWPIFAIGMLVAAGSGWLCLMWLVKLLKRAQFHQFAWYCWGIGAVAIIAFFVRS